MKCAMLALGLAACLAPAWAQDPPLVEARFHRIHLKNGNIIDGDIVQQTERTVVMRLKFGDMSIRRDQIVKIELMKIRSLGEKPVEVKPPTPKPSDVKTSPPTDTPPKPPTTDPAPAGSLREKVDQILGRLVRTPDDRKYEVMQELTRLGEGSAVFLADLLDDVDDGSRPFLAAALALMKDKSALPILGGYLKHRHPGVRFLSVEVIGATGDPAMAPELRPLLEDADLGVRSVAITALTQLGDRASFEPIARYVSDDDRALRTRAINAVFEMSRNLGMVSEMEDALVRGLERARGGARADVVNAIGRLQKKELWSSLAAVLGDEDPQVRKAAVIALGGLGEQEASEAVVQRLAAEQDKGVRLQLASAAQKLKIRRAIAPLIDWMGEEDAELKSATLLALRGISGQNVGTTRDAWAAWWAAQPRD